jgi:hypothetical protein
LYHERKQCTLQQCNYFPQLTQYLQRKKLYFLQGIIFRTICIFRETYDQFLMDFLMYYFYYYYYYITNTCFMLLNFSILFVQFTFFFLHILHINVFYSFYAFL